MATQKIPKWRAEPQEVWVNCERIKELDQGGESIVHFVVNGEKYVSFVPVEFVNLADFRLQALVIADVEGDLLVDIPVETLTSGPRILVKAGEKDSVLTFSEWDVT